MGRGACAMSPSASTGRRHNAEVRDLSGPRDRQENHMEIPGLDDDKSCIKRPATEIEEEGALDKVISVLLLMQRTPSGRGN